MDDFLEKLAEDQRRMRKYLRGQGARFMKIGKALAIARERGARIFIVGEPPLDGLTPIVSEEYLANLPAVALRLEETVATAPDQGGELDPTASSGQGPPLIARHLSRHFRSGDVLLVMAHAGQHPAIKALLGFAKLKGVFAVLLGGLDARDSLRKAADTAVTLPTKGVKTVFEALLIVARVLARCARAQVAKDGKPENDDARLIRVECGACREPVFVEERYRGKKGMCPLCRAQLKVPDTSGERASPVASDSTHEGSRSSTSLPVVAEATSDRAARGSGSNRQASSSGRKTDSRRKPKKPLKQSVLNLPAPVVEAQSASSSGPEIEEDAIETDRAKAIVNAAGEATSGGEEQEVELDDDPPPVGLQSREEPRETVIAPEDVAFDEFATATESADPFALPDAFVADLVMPQGKPEVKGEQPPSDENPVVSGDARGSDSSRKGGSSSRRGPPSTRLVSSRFTVHDCRLRFGRGGFPDDQSPEHPLEALSSTGLVFSLDPEDDLGSTLEKGDELWVRLSVPAFLEPVLARGTIAQIDGGSRGRGSRIELEWKELDAALSRKLARAAETLATA